MSHQYTILGAGLAGLSTGYNLARQGRTVSLLEKESYVGGLAASFEQDGYTFDLGPHRFHTRNQRVQRQVEELLGDNVHWRNRLSRIFMLGKFFNYPLNATNVVRSLPPWLMFRSFTDYFMIRIQHRFRPIPDDCFQNWVMKRFGKTLYKLFFGTYTEKAWGIPCTQISADWASQRITLLNLMDTVKKTIFRPKDTPRTLVSKFIYPEHGGIGHLSVRYAQEIDKLGENRVLTDAGIQRIRWKDGRVLAVDFDRDGQPQTETIQHMVSTIPLTVALDLFDPAPPEEVMASRRLLNYKAIVFVMLVLDRNKVTDDHWIYLPENHLRVHRLSEFKNFSQHCTPEGKTLVCAEITCNFDDETWNMEREALIELAAGDLERVGLIKSGEVRDAYIHRERFSYPLYDLIYRQHVKVCLDWLKGLENFHSTGRQGLFQYGNMDHSIAMGLVLADRLMGARGEDHDKLLVGEEHVD